jgi:hypothetical protein
MKRQIKIKQKKMNNQIKKVPILHKIKTKTQQQQKLRKKARIKKMLKTNQPKLKKKTQQQNALEKF